MTRWTVNIGERFIYIQDEENKQIFAVNRDGDAEENLETFEQIVREHNAHEAMRGALQVICQSIVWQGGVTYTIKDAELQHAKSALALAEEG